MLNCLAWVAQLLNRPNLRSTLRRAAAVPLLEGAAECASGGYLSSLHPENARAAAVVEGGLDGLQAGLLALLVDPQTGQWCACSSSARL